MDDRGTQNLQSGVPKNGQSRPSKWTIEVLKMDNLDPQYGQSGSSKWTTEIPKYEQSWSPKWTIKVLKMENEAHKI